MGGTVALELAARYPDLPAAIVLIDSVIFPPPAFVDALRPLGEALCGPLDRASAGQAEHTRDEVAATPSPARFASITGAPAQTYRYTAALAKARERAVGAVVRSRRIHSSVSVIRKWQ
jgi:pimeloyl-ACP methyl ester carboxylesterase